MILFSGRVQMIFNTLIQNVCKIFCWQLLPSKVRISILVLEQSVLHQARFLLMSVGSDTSLNPHEMFNSLPVVALSAGDLICWYLPLWVLCDVYPCKFFFELLDSLDIEKHYPSWLCRDHHKYRWFCWKSSLNSKKWDLVVSKVP